MKKRKYFAYCPNCGHEYKFAVEKFGKVSCVDCGREIRPQSGLPELAEISRLTDEIADEFAKIAIGLDQREREKVRGMIAERVNIACALAGFGVDLAEDFGGEYEI